MTKVQVKFYNAFSVRRDRANWIEIANTPFSHQKISGINGMTKARGHENIFNVQLYD